MIKLLKRRRQELIVFGVAITVFVALRAHLIAMQLEEGDGMAHQTYLPRRVRARAFGGKHRGMPDDQSRKTKGAFPELRSAMGRGADHRHMAHRTRHHADVKPESGPPVVEEPAFAGRRSTNDMLHTVPHRHQKPVGEGDVVEDRMVPVSIDLAAETVSFCKLKLDDYQASPHSFPLFDDLVKFSCPGTCHWFP